MFLLVFSFIVFTGCHKKTDKMETTNVDGKTEASSNTSSDSMSASTAKTIGSVEGINGTIVFYDDKVIRGGNILTREGMNYLKKQGVTDIAAVSNIVEETKLAELYGISVHPFDFSHEEGPSCDQVKNLTTIINNSTGKVYLHCVGGKNRGGTLALVYRLSVLNWEWVPAYNEFVQLGGNVEKYPEMLKSLKKQFTTKK